MPAVDVEHGLGRLVERAGAPQFLVGATAGEPLDLGLDAAVEDHAAVCAEQRLDVPVTRRPRLGALACDHQVARTRSRAARCWNAVRRWNCSQRSTTSACVTRSRRSLPKSSIANDAMTEP